MELTICIENRSLGRVQGAAQNAGDLANLITQSRMRSGCQLFVFADGDWTPVSRDGGMKILALVGDPGPLLQTYCEILFACARTTHDRAVWQGTSISALSSFAAKENDQ